MRFSLITVTYNSAGTLRDTFESVLAQSYGDFEYLVVDGASKDGTVDIIKEYEPKFCGKMRWISEPDKGLYDAMNKGMKLASGDAIILINSDDLFCDARALEKIANKFDENPHTDCVYANLYYTERNDTSKIIRHWISGEQCKFSCGWHPAHPTFYVKRSVYLRAGYFDLSYKLAADFELMLRFVEREKIKMVYLAEPLVKMRLGGATSKNLKNIFNGNVECFRAFKKNGIRVSIFYPFLRILPKFKQYFSKR